MKWRVNRSRLSGTIAIPPSKSHTIRALLVATLAPGRSIIRGPLLSGDGASAIGAARTMGASIDYTGTDLAVTGIGGNFDLGSDIFNMGNSGTSTNLFSAAASLGSRERLFDGDQSLRSRPVRPLLDALEQLGVRYQLKDPPRDLPFTIAGPLKGGQARIDGLSSQFVSALLFSCPLAQKATELSVHNLHERPYVELTLWWLAKQGIMIEHDDSLSSFHIPGGQSYTPFDLAVPSDFSSATFAATAAAIAADHTGLTLTGLDFSDPQGDKDVFDVLRLSGAHVTTSGKSVTVCPDALHGQTIDLNTMPDALPALAVLACAANGETTIVNVAQARIKETDRIAVMCRELTKMGADIQERPDGLVIQTSRLHGAVVNGHDDHRVVMALALAGFIADGETVIDTAESAEVTYPGFVEDFAGIGANIEIIAEG